MSFALEKKVMNIALKTSEKFVLLYLAMAAKDHGRCWPSVADIAKKTGMSERNALRMIDVLINKGFIEKRLSNEAKGTIYQINLSVLQKVSKFTNDNLSENDNLSDNDNLSHDNLSQNDDNLSPENDNLSENHDNLSSAYIEGIDKGIGKVGKRTNKPPIVPHRSKIRDYERTFDELWDEVRDRPFLHQMAYITKGHPAVHDRFKGIIISAVEHVAYHIIKDHKEDCLKRIKEGQTLNDWDEGILRGELYFKGLFLEHYQHRQNAERLLLGESIPEESKVFMPYYQMAFDEFINRCRNLFSQYQEKALDPEWAPFCHRYGDGPWIFRKYTHS